MRIGAHVSIAGGIDKALGRAKELGQVPKLAELLKN